MADGYQWSGVQCSVLEVKTIAEVSYDCGYLVICCWLRPTQHILNNINTGIITTSTDLLNPPRLARETQQAGDFMILTRIEINHMSPLNTNTG